MSKIRDLIEALGVRPEVGGRYLFLDELRGIAALMVVLFHFYSEQTNSPIHEPLKAIFPAAIDWALTYGYLGVQVFFVLSGFVIVNSLHRTWITPGYSANFAVRRSIRLDPPYWTIIGLMALSMVARPGWQGQFRGDSGGSIDPIGWGLLANLVYLQDLLGYPSLLGVAWTLCLEVQFYLATILMIGLGQRLVGKAAWESGRGLRSGSVALVIPTYLGSLGYWLFIHHRTALGYWHMFSLGALLNWSLTGRIPRAWFWVAALLPLAGGLALGEPVTVFATVVAAVIALAGEVGFLARGFGSRVLLYLGRISYSLYLVHLMVGKRCLHKVIAIFGLSTASALLAFGVAIASSVIAAHLLHVAVERPTLILSRRLKPKRPEVLAVGTATP